MALLNKLFFSNSSSKKKAQNVSSQPPQYFSHFPFDENQVRILLYRECEIRGRRLLFDSSAIEKVNGSLTEQNPVDSSSSAKANGFRVKRKSSSSSYIEISEGFSYKHLQGNTGDIANIGEMVFGSLAMSYRGTALKVHWLQSPARLLCSQVFLSPVHSSMASQKRNSNTILSGQLVEQSSMDNTSMNSFSMPFTVCIKDNMNLLAENSLTNPLTIPCEEYKADNTRLFSTLSAATNSDSGCYDTWATSNSSYCQYSTRSSLGSVFSDHESLRKLSIDSVSAVGNNPVMDSGCLQRRISRNVSTSFENRSSVSDYIGFIGDNYQTATNGGSDSCIQAFRRCSDANENRSNPEMIRKRGASGDTILTKSSSNRSGHSHNGRRAKLGLAICITLSEPFEKEMELFCSEHIAVLESMLCRLRASAESAYINHKNFLQIMLHAWKATKRCIRDLFTAPRLPYPIWLTLNRGKTKSTRILAESFMKELCYLLSSADTKDTNFFVSTMLTAILTHHLGWVTTVTNSLKPGTITGQKEKLIEVSRCHPYNALWAQMGDLYGAIGNPPKISRTIVYGTEKHTIDKVLNVLTYFIRCGEVKRISTTESIDKTAMNKAFGKLNTVTEIQTDTNKSNIDVPLKSEKKSFGTGGKGGLSRTQTCTKNLSDIGSIYAGENIEQNMPDSDEPKKQVMNDIPNVLAYRDSHFVQQELRIGNFLMDTGIEMNAKQKEDAKTYKIREQFRLCDITENNNTDNKNISHSNVVEAIEIDTDKELCSENADITEKSSLQNCFSTTFPWQERVKEGMSWEDLEESRQSNIRNKKSLEAESYKNCDLTGKPIDQTMERSHSLYNLRKQQSKNEFVHLQSNPKSKNVQTNLSHLITANSVGQEDERFTWGIEPGKETISHEEEMHFEISKKLVEREINKKESTGGVVFVLGDNEALVNIKKSTEDLEKSHDSIKEPKTANLLSPSASTTTAAISENKEIDTNIVKRRTCNHKKHSGVKFNFEQYPQIATNYMKNKNIDLSNYNFFEKSSKINEILNCGSSTSAFPVVADVSGTKDKFQLMSMMNVDKEQCECCAAAGSRILQTPSNATELEFEPDDNNYPIVLTRDATTDRQTKDDLSGTTVSASAPESVPSHIKLNIPSLSIESEKSEPEVAFLKLPIPKNVRKKINNAESSKDEMEIVPSLFTGVNDHYIPDMVLQGTIASPETWEMNLKQDLALAAHCATLIPGPMENIAVVADLEKWDVKVVSSQTYVLSNSHGTSGPVGMSQLVSSMLETVHAMCDSGISAFECMTFLESKLQEMYLQSEALAAFLLATEFCSLHTVTSALNLSANDVPLLLSVASIHSPQVTKKYGVSSR